jgi:hypothetical protein
MKKMEDGKSVRETFGFYPIDGKPIKPLVGMIYWYGWGDNEDFDIRIVRRILGLTVDQPKLDKWFMEKKPNRCKAYAETCRQIDAAIKELGRGFADIMEEHDRFVEDEAGRFMASAKKRNKVDKTGDCLHQINAKDIPFAIVRSISTNNVSAIACEDFDEVPF